MVFSESILVCQPTRAKALNPTHTTENRLLHLLPFLWRRERSVHSNLSERASGHYGSLTRSALLEG